MNFLTKHSKAFYYAYGILIGALIILGVFYLSQYENVRVLFSKAGGVVTIAPLSSDGLQHTNTYVFEYFANGNSNGLVAATGLSTDFGTAYAMKVYDFQILMSHINDLIITFGVISLVCFAFLLVFANHSRRIYYKSNIIAGVIFPVIVIVLNVILLAENLKAMGIFSENQTLFNIVSVLQGEQQTTMSQQSYDVISKSFTCNNLSFVLYSVLFVVVIAYSVFLAIYAVLKYKVTAEERAEIEKKAVANND